MASLLRVIAIATVMAGLAVGAATAQTPHTDHTYRLDDPAKRLPGTFADVGWLVGSWTGSAFEGTFEEVWNPPSANSMVGMFKLLKNNEIEFYELLLLAQEEGSLNLKVKHFNADFSAWEEKHDYVNFRLVHLEENAIHFSGISFYRIDDDEIHAYLALRDGDRFWEEKLVYYRD